MGYNVTSNFIEQLDSKSPDLIRKFTIAGSDYSSRVTKWPTFDKTWDDIRPKTLAMKLANGDQGMNFLREDKTLMENNCEVILGVEEKIDDPFNFTLLDRDTNHKYVDSEELALSTLRLNVDGTKLYIMGDNNRELFQYTLSPAYDLTTASYDSISYDFSLLYTLIEDVVFKPDGLRMYISEWNSKAIREFTIATAWDLSSTITEVVGSTDVSTEIPNFVGHLAVKPDGTKFYVIDFISNVIYQYGLLTAWDITSGSYDSAALSVNTVVPNAEGFYFSSSGSELYVVDQDQIIYQYDLSTAWLLSTATYNSVNQDLATVAPIGRGIHLTDDGLYVYVTSENENIIVRFTLATAWDLSTLVMGVNDYHITDANNDDPVDISFNADGSSSIVLDWGTSRLYKYNFTIDYSLSTGSQDATYYYFGGTETNPTGFFIDESGEHLYISGVAIGGRIHEYSLSPAFDLSAPTLVSSTTFAETVLPQSVQFSSDGLKMFIMSSTFLYQYTLSTAWLASSATYDSVNYDYQAYAGVCNSFVFKPDGTHLYTLARGSSVYDFILSTAWDLSDTVTGVSASTTFASMLANQPRGFAINPDGSAVYTVSDIPSGPTSIHESLISKSPADQIVLFSGKTKKLAYARENLTMTLVDKFQQLSDRKVGVNDVPVSYVGSNYLPSDVAWWIATSYGGFSDITSTSNPDIDYEDFQTWAAVFSGDSIFIEAEFDGQKCTEIMRKLSKITNSAIFIKENKISFRRFGIADAAASSLHDGNIRNLSLSFDSSKMVNKQFVAGNYDPDSGHLFNVFDESTASVNSFGLKENLYKDESVWYPSSGSAINLAQRLILSGTEEEDDINIETNLNGAIRLIGETVHVTDDFHSINGPYRIIGHKIDMDKGRTDLKVDRSQFSVPFILDVSTLDSTLEVLT